MVAFRLSPEVLGQMRFGCRVHYGQTPLATTLARAGVLDADRSVG